MDYVNNSMKTRNRNPVLVSHNFKVAVLNNKYVLQTNEQLKMGSHYHMLYNSTNLLL
jgi:hypothetical protein